MNAVGIIPARMNASRFPGKPLAEMYGMPMIGHVYHRTNLVKELYASYVATCDKEIAKYIKSIGGNAVMTSSSHTRATTRTAEAINCIESEFGKKIDIIVMVQGDEPLIQPDTISETLKHFEDSGVDIVNVMSCLRSHDHFLDKNNVKVVVDKNNNALYFSREPIPSPWKGIDDFPKYMQTGVIAFRRDAILSFNSMSESPLEQIESVDMNRVLEAGGKIRMVKTDYLTMGIDTLEELKYAENLLIKDITLKKYLR